jgi:nucleotide-binding universal stress UspA family protein
VDLVVGHDLTARGDDALRAAIVLSRAEGGLSACVVHVLTQQDLDKTGRLSASEKQQAAVEGAYPRVWKRIEEVQEDIGLDAESLEVDVVVRVAPVHLVRSQAKIAEILVELARDFAADRVVLGRRGRPDGVADHLTRASERLGNPPDSSEDVLVLRLPSVVSP